MDASQQKICNETRKPLSTVKHAINLFEWCFRSTVLKNVSGTVYSYIDLISGKLLHGSSHRPRGPQDILFEI